MTPPAQQATDAVLRAQLTRTWYPFFGRFGTLTATQRAAIPQILPGTNVLLVAPTASGKTEALVAPLVERYVQPLSGGPRLRLLIVAPTRALGNDLTRRLDVPLRNLGLQLARKNSDAPKLRIDKLPDVLVTTPESLDSLLCEHAAALEEVRAIVVDEVHLLAAAERGDHLLHLIERVRRAALRRDPDAMMQVCASSASIADPAALARRFCGPDALPVEVREGLQRPIDLTIHEAPLIQDAVRHLRSALTTTPDRKRLVFVNRRRDAETLGAALGDLTPPTVHHGSLSKEERLRVERAFQARRGALCVATSTLEIGVDIGDIDEVWLVDPPFDVASYLQRAGRGNRRSARIAVHALARHRLDKLRFEHLDACAAQGRLHEEACPPRPAVIAQQALSLCAQNRHRRIAAEPLWERMAPEARAFWTLGEIQELLREMAAEGWLEKAGATWTLSERSEDQLKRGKVHTAFAATQGVAVRDAVSGQVVGEIAYGAAASLDKGDSFAIGGRGREVLRVEKRAVVVHNTDTDKPGTFLSAAPPSLSRALCEDLKAWVGFPPERVVVRAGTKECTLEHWAGRLRSTLLAHTLQALRRASAKRVHELTCKVSSRAVSLLDKPLGDEHTLRDTLEALDPSVWLALEGTLSPGRLVATVPLSMRLRWVQAALDLPREARWLASLRFTLDDRVDSEDPP